MRRSLLVGLTLLGLLVLSHGAAASMVWVVHHPFPDDRDPLGSEFEDGLGYPESRFLAGRSFGYPVAHFDGAVLYQGIPPGEGSPFERVQTAYDATFDERLALGSPVEILVSTDNGTRVAEVEGDLPAGIHWRAVYTQDGLEFKPPEAVSNGITVHRYVALETHELGLVNGSLVLPPAPPNATHVALILEQFPHPNAQLEAGEVLQAHQHDLSLASSQSQGKAVLVEELSATWCDPCLLGDIAIHNIEARVLDVESGSSWTIPIPNLNVLILALIGASAFLYREIGR